MRPKFQAETLPAGELEWVDNCLLSLFAQSSMSAARHVWGIYLDELHDEPFKQEICFSAPKLERNRKDEGGTK
jgi:hypothetical protein